MNRIDILIISVISLSVFCLITSCSVIKNSAYNKNLTMVNLKWDGLDRTYYTYIPKNISPNQKSPLLFHLHGGGGTGKGTPGLTFGRFNELADKNGFIVVYPDAMEKNWNDGRPLEQVLAWEEDIDDVGFIMKIIRDIKNEYTIDESRIFTSGMSNGGFMSSRLICDRPGVFKGAAILTATISSEYINSCNPERPVSVLLMNGTEDPLIPYEGGEIIVYKKNRGSVVSTNDYINFWADNNNCGLTGEISELPDLVDDGTSVVRTVYPNCKNGSKVEKFDIIGGGHTWPGGLQYLGEKTIGKTSQDINACDVIWNFFENL